MKLSDLIPQTMSPGRLKVWTTNNPPSFWYKQPNHFDTLINMLSSQSTTKLGASTIYGHIFINGGAESNWRWAVLEGIRNA